MITPADVLNLMEIELTDDQVNPYITSATVFVDANLSGKGIDDDLLDEIKIWVTAHMISVTRDRLTKKEKAGEAEVEYFGKMGMALEASHYGQMAMTLDNTGTLRSLSSDKQAWLFAIKE